MPQSTNKCTAKLQSVSVSRCRSMTAIASTVAKSHQAPIATRSVEKMQSDLTEQESAPVSKPKKKSKTLWYNGVLGVLSTCIAGLEFFTGFLKEFVPGWFYIVLLLICALNNGINWVLRLKTTEPVK